MKGTNMKMTIVAYSVLFTGFMMAAAAPSFADCDPSAISGVWSRSMADGEQADSGTTWVLNFQDDALIAKTQLTDNLTMTGAYGPYFEKETHYDVTYSPDCTLTLNAKASTARSYRLYGEPTADVSETTVDESGAVSTFRAVVGADGQSLVLSGEGSAAVTFKRD
jgi:hypothetical protein